MKICSAVQWWHGTFRVTSSHPSCGGGVGLGLDMARARAGQHGHPTVPAEDLLSVNRGKKKKLVTELIARLATPGVDTVMFSSLLRFLSTGEYPSQVRCAGAALSLSNLMWHFAIPRRCLRSRSTSWSCWGGSAGCPSCWRRTWSTSTSPATTRTASSSSPGTRTAPRPAAPPSSRDTRWSSVKPVIQEIANDKLEHVRRNLLVLSFLVLFWSVRKINGLSVNYDVWTQVWESAGWEEAADCECPQAGAEPLHPPAAGRGHLRHGREGRVMQVRVLRVSSVVSSTSIHFLTAGEDGEADHNRTTKPSSRSPTPPRSNTRSTPSPRSRICDKSPRTPTRIASLTVPPTQACFF